MQESNKNILDLSTIKKTIESFFTGLEFQEDIHKYSYEGEPLTSVSHTYKKFVDEPDFDVIAGYVAKSRGVSKQDILDEWRESGEIASRLGTEVHYFAEHYPETKLNPTNGYEEAFCVFWNSIPDNLVPISHELQMYSKDLKVAGTCDLLLYNKDTGKFKIVDYKTNKDLYKNYRGKRLLPPFHRLLDMPIEKYSLQLSFYQILFEQTGFEVEERVIIWLKPNGEYEKLSLADHSKTLLKEFTNES